jgi:hypothetical protein
VDSSIPSSQTQQGSKAYIFLTTFVPAIGGFLFGYQMTIVSGTQPAMAASPMLNAPSQIVFPRVCGGSIFVVILGGRLFFGERMIGLTAGMVSLGRAAVVLLSLS